MDNEIFQELVEEKIAEENVAVSKIILLILFEGNSH